jgi:farnesyl-diphosphate farnesyltransferase
MGEGMAKYAGEKTVVTLEDYNEYCHYVAGFVGIGLSQMFAASGLERMSHRVCLALSSDLWLTSTVLSLSLS